MEMIERYLQEIGKHLPSKDRTDIQSELRSSLEDAAEARAQGEPSQDDIAEVLKEMGSPRTVAASYYPEGQYLIGPELYPLFKMVVGIVLAAITGALLIAALVPVVFSQAPFLAIDTLLGILNSLLPAFGMVVIVFAVLQRFDLQPELEREGEFDPRALPPVTETETVSRTEQIFSLVFGAFLLALLAAFQSVNQAGTAGYFSNPVLVQYLPWIVLLLVLGIVVDIVLLWRGEWQTGTRIANFIIDGLTLILIAILIQAHNATLAEAGIAGLGDSIDLLPAEDANSRQLVGMFFFRWALIVVFIVTSVELVGQLFRIVRSELRKRSQKSVASTTA